MSYQFSENAYSRLHLARDALRLLKHSSQQASPGAMLDCGLLGSYLTLIDEQLSQTIDDAVMTGSTDGF